LYGVEYTPIKDRIEAGTYLIAAASCGGEIETEGVPAENITALLHKLRENGCQTYIKNDKITLISSGRLKSVNLVETTPFPGFPTDMQAQYAALCTTAKGTTLIVENLFETRYKYAGELKRMGADITVRDRTAVIRGVEHLHGARVVAGDLRGGAALVLAGLQAEGVSEVADLSHIDRGYDGFEYKLRRLGAKIKRVRI
jgi:UDP-N-acetylglucosamine 1-carboxyvinyltransferase